MRARMIFAVGLSCSLGWGCPPDPEPPPPPAPVLPPGPSNAAIGCVISADCPAGQHCSLGECLQECNTVEPCGGDQVCSPRARCIEEGKADQDPPPSTLSAGTFDVTPRRHVLTQEDRALDVTLVTTAAGSVPYRIEVTAPYLGVSETRGTFEGQKRITVTVDPRQGRGGDLGGGLRIVTPFGDRFVSAPLKRGLTGVYVGQMTYDQGLLPLGSASLALELLESAGSVSARADRSTSLLFGGLPDGSGVLQSSSGAGRYNDVDRLLDVTLWQRIEASYGAGINPLARALVRKVRFLLRPSAADPMVLEGTFEEQIYGLAPEAATLRGTTFVRYDLARAPAAFITAAPPALPPAAGAGSYLIPSDVFAWREGGGASCPAVAAAACAMLSVDRLACSTSPERYAPELARALMAPLRNSIGQGIRGTGSYSSLADACRQSLQLMGSPSPIGVCGMMAPLACTLPLLQRRDHGGASGALADATLYGEVVAALLGPPLLVAKDEVVQGLKASIVDGTAAERERYVRALETLRPMARWVLQPAVFEFLRTMPPEAARGPLPGVGAPMGDTFPAARAIADLLATTSLVAAEIARIDLANNSGGADAARGIQDRALFTELTAATLVQLIDSWGRVPEGVVPLAVASRFIGVLTPLDRSFSGTVNGANVFGIPAGFVPFVYRTGGAGLTNLEQVLDLASNAVEAFQLAEGSWERNARTFESNEMGLRSEIAGIRGNYDQQLSNLCGSAFNIENAEAKSEWERCGRDRFGQPAGEIGGRLLEVDAAQVELNTLRSRHTKKLDELRWAKDSELRVGQLRESDLVFQTAIGGTINLLRSIDRSVETGVRCLEISSNANLLNAFSSVGLAGAAAPLLVAGLIAKTSEDHLELIRTARAGRTNLDIDAIRALERLHVLLLEAQQLEVELANRGITVVQAAQRVSAAYEQAFRLYAERRKLLAELNGSLLRDPSFRVLRDRDALELLRSRAAAQRMLSLAGRALGYELNAPIEAIDGSVLNASSATRMQALLRCYRDLHGQDLAVLPEAAGYRTRISVRRELGITGDRTDEVTGQLITAGEQFRRRLLDQENLGADGAVSLRFATNLLPDNPLWSADLCRDRISTVEAELVGDFLGDSEAQINIGLEGLGFLRSCDVDTVHTWDFGGDRPGSSLVAVVQAGVNSSGGGQPNPALFGQPVARATWKLTIPGPRRAPANRDLDLTHLEDIIVVVNHQAVSSQAGVAFTPDTSCLSAGR